MDILYSIIIPHRNSIDLLKRAVTSIPERADIQIIVVDNSPIPLSFSFLDEFINKNILLLYSDPEKGAGHARNIGLKHSEGFWLLFLDADDFYNPGAFEKFDLYDNSDYNIIYFSSNSLFSDTLKIADRHVYNNQLVDDFILKKDTAEDSLRYDYITPYCKLINNSFVIEYGFQFDEVPASNDLMFSVKTGHYANRVSANSFAAYCVTVNRGSLTRTISKINSRSRYCTYIRQYQFMTKIGRLDLRFLLMATIILSLRFGFKEFWFYLSLAYKEKVNIFLGFERWPKVLFDYCFKRKNEDDYTIFIK